VNKVHTNGKPNPRFIIMERREKVHMMLSQGLNETEIAVQLNVDQSTISRDVKTIKKESQRTIEEIAKKILPYEFGKSILSLNQIIKACWNIYEDKSNRWTNKDKLNALKLLKETERTRFELLMQGPVNLSVQQMQEQLKEIVESNETTQKSFFVLPSLKRPNDEDLR